MARQRGHAGEDAGPRVGRSTLSMSTWLAAALLGVTVASLLVASAVALTRASQLTDGVAAQRAGALLTLQADEAERYLRSTRRAAATAAATGTVRAAVGRFATSFDALSSLEPAVVAEAARGVAASYRRTLIPTLEQVADEPVRLRSLLPTRGAALYLQQRYPVGTGPRGTAPAVDAGDGSRWSADHAELHPLLSELSAQLGFVDLYLVDPGTGVIVYSVAKLPDLGTSLDAGPYSGSALARAVDAVRADPGGGPVLTDVVPYGAVGGRPAAFVAAPVLDDARLVGVVAARIDLGRLDRIMTVGGGWRAAGFGSSGETFLVGADGTMRTVARSWVEDPDAYLRALTDVADVAPATREAIAAAGTPVAQQPVLTDDELATVTADAVELPDVRGPLGGPARTVAVALDVPGVDWAAVLQVDPGEADARIVAFRRTTVLVTTVVVLVVAFLAVLWARWVFRPVRLIGGRLRALVRGDDAAPSLRGRVPEEFAALSMSVDRMVAALARRRAEVRRAVEERRRVMRAVLPAEVVARLEAGDDHVVDQIDQATVVVLRIDGLDRLAWAASRDGRGLLHRLVGTLDPLARRHGLTRVKLLGDAYFAGCGVERPHLDHAARALAFAVDAHDAVGRLAADAGVDAGLSVGLDSGPVAVGLTGSALLVFDMWGETPGVAHVLARTARPGQILASDRTRSLLPADAAVTRVEGVEPPAWAVGGDRSAGEDADADGGADVTPAGRDAVPTGERAT